MISKSTISAEAPGGQAGAPGGQPGAPGGQPGAPGGQPVAPGGHPGAPGGQIIFFHIYKCWGFTHKMAEIF